VQEFVDSQAKNIPLERVGPPDEIAKAVVFLPCGGSNFVSGTELFVGGGRAQI
jgi:NAD(P)-dependent dehydrogenase (short-subunit alcohol dehydrogenase family)